MSWTWQHGITVLLIGMAMVYLARHMLRSMSTAPGAGCGVDTGCKGCATRTSRCVTSVCPPPVVIQPTFKARD